MTESLTVKPKENCRWDLVSLGEVMLRLAPPSPGRARRETGSPARGDRSRYRSTKIGNNVCIGSNATILPGLIDNHTHVLLQGDITSADYDEQLLKESNPYRAIRARSTASA